MYSDYTFYAETYKGQLKEAEYERQVVRATAEIDRLTFGRAAQIAPGEMPDAIKLAECAVIDELARQSVGGAGDIVSETNDGISRSYASGVVRSSRQRIESAAMVFLANTNYCCCII